MNLKKSDKQYDYSALLESDIDSDPIKQFEKWFNESTQIGIKYPNAFVENQMPDICCSRTLIKMVLFSTLILRA